MTVGTIARCLPERNEVDTWGTGYRGIVGDELRICSSGGETPPSAVANLHAERAVDINNEAHQMPIGIPI